MNDPVKKKRRWPVVAMVAVVGLALLAVVLAAGYLYLPTLVSERLPLDQIRQLGFDAFSGRVIAIGPTRVVAGPFVFGSGDRPAVAIGNVEVNFSPAGLRRKQVGLIRVSDVVVNADVTPDGIVLPGMDPAAMISPTHGEPSTSAEMPSPLAGARLERLEIKSGRFNLRLGEVTLGIPFALDLVPADDGMRVFDAHLRCAVRDQALTVDAEVDLTRQAARIKLNTDHFALDAVGDLSRLFTGLALQGEVSLTARASLALSPFSVSDVGAEATWHSGRLRLGSLDLAPAGPGAAVFSVTGPTLDALQIRAGGMHLALPLPLQLDSLTADVRREKTGHTMTGRARLNLPPSALDSSVGLALKTEARLALNLSATRAGDATWRTEVTTVESETTPPPLELVAAQSDATLSAPLPRFRLTADGQGAAGKLDWTFSMGAVRGTVAGTSIALPSVTGDGDLAFSSSAGGLRCRGRAGVRTPALKVGGGSFSGALNAISLAARVVLPAGGAAVVDGRLRAAGGRIVHAQSGFSASGVELDLPVGQGIAPADVSGRILIRQILWGKTDLGDIRAAVRRGAEAYTLDATAAGKVLPGLTARIDGTVHTATDRVGDGDFTVTVPTWTLPADTDLGRFLPAARGVTLTGSIGGKAVVSRVRGHLTGEMSAALTGGKLQIQEKKVTVEGIAAAMRFPDLPRIRSAPAQKLTFDRAAMGGIVVDGGRFELQMESENTLFVEEGRLSWCDGVVDTGSLRIAAGRQDYHLNLYCQRLSLSRILEQLGTVNARGTGTVNGRIPIDYNNGKIRFDDGFLFSTPGEGGQIQLTGTDILTRGIPSDTPQFAQVELAREALKDYAYDWAKVGLVSEGDDFVLRLQFDGKPAHPLPFVYKKEIGSFVRIEAGGKGSVFQGIGLDVNLRLPLNQLLQYKDIVNMIQ